MERIVLRHLTGSRAGRAEEYCLDGDRDLVLGRAPTAAVRFDPTRDDVVGRRHARIARRLDRYALIDLDSRNGTFLNRQRVLGSVAMTPGDTIQLGAGGPSLRFEIAPQD